MRKYAELLALAKPIGGAKSAGDPGSPAGKELAAVAKPANDTLSEQQTAEALMLDVLGSMEGGKVKVFSRYHRRSEIIPDAGRLKYEHLLQIAGPPARAKVVEIAGDETPPGMFLLRDVRRSIAMLAGFRKITDGTEIGAGCWYGLDAAGNPTNSTVIVGSSEAAYWNGDRVLHRIEHPVARGRLLDFDQTSRNWYDFDKLSSLIVAAGDPEFRRRARNDCISLFSRWRWKQASSPIILTGLVFSTWVQTLWEWRPQVSVIGPSSSGKSMLCKAISSIFGNLTQSTSDATAAGIRQLIQNSAKVILFDEFDTRDPRQAEEQQKILKMLRAAGRGDASVRGSSGQKAVIHTLRHIVWLLGIQIKRSDQADRNRDILSELLPPTEEKRGQLTVPPAEELHDLGQRMLATAIYCIHDARRLAVQIKDTRIDGVDDRVVESHAVPAAMLAIVSGPIGSETIEQTARGMLAEMLAPLATDPTAKGATDEQDLMNEILAAPIQIGPNRFSVAQLVENVIRMGPANDIHATALESRGLKIGRFSRPADSSKGSEHYSGDPCFLMAHKAISEHLIKNTKWGTQAIEQILRRLPGAQYSRRRIGGQRAYSVQIPLGYLMSEFLGLDATGAETEAADAAPSASGGQF